jgi:hypothetical protein
VRSLKPNFPIGKSPSSGTLDLLVKIDSRPQYHSKVVSDDQQQYTSLHMNLLRDQLRKLLATAASLITTIGEQDGAIQAKLKSILVEKKGFFWDDIYSAKQINLLLDDNLCSTVLMTLYTFLTMAQIGM